MGALRSDAQFHPVLWYLVNLVRCRKVSGRCTYIMGKTPMWVSELCYL